MQDDHEPHARQPETGSVTPKPKARKIDCYGNPEIADRRIEHRRGGHRSTSHAPIREDDKLGG